MDQDTATGYVPFIPLLDGNAGINSPFPIPNETNAPTGPAKESSQWTSSYINLTPPEQEPAIVIEPNMAYGTGSKEARTVNNVHSPYAVMQVLYDSIRR